MITAGRLVRPAYRPSQGRIPPRVTAKWSDRRTKSDAGQRDSRNGSIASSVSAIERFGTRGVGAAASGGVGGLGRRLGAGGRPGRGGLERPARSILPATGTGSDAGIGARARSILARRAARRGGPRPCAPAAPVRRPRFQSAPPPPPPAPRRPPRRTRRGDCSARPARDGIAGRENVAEPRRGIPLEAAADQRAPLGRDVQPIEKRGRGRWRRISCLCADGRAKRRQNAGQHLVKDDPERVDVDRRRHSAPGELLRRHVAEGSRHQRRSVVLQGAHRWRPPARARKSMTTARGGPSAVGTSMTLSDLKSR